MNPVSSTIVQACSQPHQAVTYATTFMRLCGLHAVVGGRSEAANPGPRALRHRPEHFTLTADAAVSAEVIGVEPTGSDTEIALCYAGHPVTAAFRERIAARPGDRLALALQAAQSHVFDAARGDG